MINNKNGIYTLDSHYVRPNLAAIHLIREGDQLALVETANAHSLVHVESALKQLALQPEQVKYIILTHIHLDHAGGAGAFMQRFPLAKLVVHPKGARHMCDPSKLEASVIEVYGAEFVSKMYGKLQPIDSQRLLIAEDGLSLDLNGRQLICRHTPGHANHHLAVIDCSAQAVFTGDVFGVAYPELVDAVGKRFIFPTTTPVNFNPELMHQSIDLIVAYQPKQVYLTHYGELGQVSEYAERLHQMVADFVALAEGAASSRAEEANFEPLVVAIKTALDEYMWQEAQRFAILLAREDFQALVDVDNQINAQGLAVWLKSRG